MDGNAIESLSDELLAALPKAPAGADPEVTTESLIEYVRAADVADFRAQTHEYLAARIEQALGKAGLATK